MNSLVLEYLNACRATGALEMKRTLNEPVTEAELSAAIAREDDAWAALSDARKTDGDGVSA